ncbi:MAG: hypothetical protein LKH59_03465 [Lactobacillus crispatus]|jgi:hypothetical protein|nr:hypothetical protein [Lactobacillus crispatus]MCI1335272.1 hypothetical protein [Lactobacillus crispatus]MCI1364932.1 hypothetical protein [Lactobacillus crispatus]MCI1493555.1 hypothetical protein [Lactobacillus crispatus]MCI1537929.1 hypothetical protein [Lactobacillus crispatus]
MEESELKEFESVKDTNLESTVGGHRHSRAYHDGWVAGKVASIASGVATVVSVGLKIYSMCCASKDNKN